MRNIKEGDEVQVVMTHNDVFAFQKATEFRAVVKSTPANTGDIWYLEADGGIDIAINPMSQNFVGLVLLVKAS